MKEEISTYLKNQVGDEQELLDALYGEYCSSAKEKVDALKAAMPSGDFAVLKQLAHTLKGNSSMVGDNDMHEHALAFEMGAKANDITVCEKELVEIEKLLTTLV